MYSLINFRLTARPPPFELVGTVVSSGCSWGSLLVMKVGVLGRSMQEIAGVIWGMVRGKTPRLFLVGGKLCSAA